MKKIGHILLISIISIFFITACTKTSDVSIEDIKENDKNSNKEMEAFNIYDMDIDYNVVISNSLEIQKNEEIEYKLKEIADEISKSKFDNAIIEVKKIKNNIAYINLKEDTGNKWSTTYFQGSLGGSITTSNLIENFLQREYDGEWIEGVYFTYNDEFEDVEFDHVGVDCFGNVIKR